MGIGEKYNTALIAVEANSIGYATCLKLVESKYKNIYYSMKGQFNSRNRKRIEQAFKNKDAMVPGFQTTTASRPLLMSQLEEEVRTMSVIIHSVRTTQELRTLIWKNGRPEATAGYHDDLSMALGIGMLIIATTLKEIAASKQILHETLKGISSNYNDAEESIAQLNLSNKKNNDSNPWVMTDMQGNEEDISWLIK